MIMFYHTFVGFFNEQAGIQSNLTTLLGRVTIAEYRLKWQNYNLYVWVIVSFENTRRVLIELQLYFAHNTHMVLSLLFVTEDCWTVHSIVLLSCNVF